MARLPSLSIPRPTNFLHFMSLRTGTFLILLTQLVNKVTAFYGILALATAYPLNSVQLSMYIYSLLALVFTLYLAPHIRRGSAWHCLAFAQSYALDTLINALYTAVFTVSWFMVLAASDHDAARRVPGAETIDETAGFTSPQHNVSQVDVIAAPAGGIKPGQDAVAVGSGPGSALVGGGPGLWAAVVNSGSLMSLSIILAFWALRVYAVFVVMAHARQVLRQHIQLSATSNWQLHSGAKSSDVADDPFAHGREDGAGWKGRLGRLMVAVGRDYWLGRDDDDDTWIRMMGGKFRKSNEHPNGTMERERRRRSGTDPPLPPPGLLQQM